MAASTPLVQAGKWTSGGTGRLGPGLPWASWVTGQAHHEIPAAVPVGGVLRQARRLPVAGFPSSRHVGACHGAAAETVTSQSASFRLAAGVQPARAANQAAARSATPATNETAARTR